MRQSWNHYFMDLAKAAATRATCDRRHVGCVLTRSKSVIATGYNGAMPGAPHCIDEGCVVEDNHCVSVVHAECNAVAQAARRGVVTDGAVAYVTAYPCWPCFKVLVSAGVYWIVYAEAYKPDPKVAEHAKRLGIRLDDVATLP